MTKTRPWYGVSVPADLKDEAHVRTFLEHVCDALGASVWSRNSGTGTIYPSTITDIVSIGAATAPYNSADLGLWHSLGLAHSYVTSAAGVGITEWHPTIGNTVVAFDEGVGVWEIGTDTNNAIAFNTNGVPRVGITRLGDLVPLDAAGGQNLGYPLGFRFKALYVMDGTSGNNYGIDFGPASGVFNARINNVNGSEFRFACSGGTATDVSIECGDFISGNPNYVFIRAGTSTIAKGKYSSDLAGTDLPWLPGTDDQNSLGGKDGTTGYERWLDLHMTRDIAQFKHINCYHGNETTVTAISAGWGNTATSAVRTDARDTVWIVSITANGAGIAANPTVTVTFGDPYTNGPATAALSFVHQLEYVAGEVHGNCKIVSFSTTEIVFRWLATPVAGEVYKFQGFTIGHHMAVYP